MKLARQSTLRRHDISCTTSTPLDVARFRSPWSRIIPALGWWSTVLPLYLRPTVGPPWRRNGGAGHVPAYSTGSKARFSTPSRQSNMLPFLWFVVPPLAASSRLRSVKSWLFVLASDHTRPQFTTDMQQPRAGRHFQVKVISAALLFPGQGSEYVSMMNNAKDIPPVREMLSIATRLLGFRLARCVSARTTRKDSICVVQVCHLT